MSRTFHHGARSKKKYDPWHDKHRDPSLPKKKRSHLSPWTFWMSTPSRWIREMMTRPQRAEVRNLIAKLHRLPDIEDTPLFPLAKKPHHYYW